MAVWSERHVTPITHAVPQYRVHLVASYNEVQVVVAQEPLSDVWAYTLRRHHLSQSATDNMCHSIHSPDSAWSWDE